MTPAAPERPLKWRDIFKRSQKQLPPFLTFETLRASSREWTCCRRKRNPVAHQTELASSLCFPASSAHVRCCATSTLFKGQTARTRNAGKRAQVTMAVEIAPGKRIELSPGEHSELIRQIIEGFAPRFAPGATLIYAGDTGDKWGYFDAPTLGKLGVEVESHGKMPDVVLHDPKRNWLMLIESVTSHGPVDGKRHSELSRLFAAASAGLVYVTAFPNRAVMGRYLSDIAWETEVWVADAPSHLIHFNGERFLGPYNPQT